MVKARALYSYLRKTLGTPYQTFAFQASKGLFGEKLRKSTGKGVERMFELDDVLAIRVISELLALTQSRNYRTLNKVRFSDDIIGALKRIAKEKLNADWLTLFWVGPPYSQYWLHTWTNSPDFPNVKTIREKEAGRAVPFIALQYKPILKEVQEFYAKNDTP
jgi:hypothetical protein